MYNHACTATDISVGKMEQFIEKYESEFEDILDHLVLFNNRKGVLHIWRCCKYSRRQIQSNSVVKKRGNKSNEKGDYQVNPHDKKESNMIKDENTIKQKVNTSKQK